MQRSDSQADMASTGGGTRIHILAPVVGTILLAVVTTAVLLIYDDPFAWMGDWGYSGAFLVMLVNNLTIILPAFGQAFIAAAAQTLNPWVLGIVGGLGAAVGEISGYVVGRSGGKTVGRRLFARYGGSRVLRANLMGPTLFVFALTPLPFDVAGIVAGGTHYPFSRFMLWMGAGKVINAVLIALGSYYTIDWLSGLLD
ncbi:MAG: VTT domain-containing protein [Chloroflexi bacterium]|nr:VTT domain-containing protein [Chloroflexota bacterium]